MPPSSVTVKIIADDTHVVLVLELLLEMSPKIFSTWQFKKSGLKLAPFLYIMHIKGIKRQLNLKHPVNYMTVSSSHIKVAEGHYQTYSVDLQC